MEEAKKAHKKHEHCSIAVKRQAITRLESGEATTMELARELNVHPCSLSRWRAQLNFYGEENCIVVNKYAESFKRKVVGQIEAGILDLKQAALKHGIRDYRLIKSWQKQYSSVNLAAKTAREMQETSPLAEDQPGNTPDERKELEKKLQNAQLKIALLEAMIDIADQEFKTDIRKKAGAKQ
jgi:transposase-like protein